jgi:hypothetical protein
MKNYFLWEKEVGVLKVTKQVNNFFLLDFQYLGLILKHVIYKESIHFINFGPCLKVQTYGSNLADEKKRNLAVSYSVFCINKEPVGNRKRLLCSA